MVYVTVMCIEIEGYSIAYLIGSSHSKCRITELSVKGRAHTQFVDVWKSNESKKHMMEVQHYSASSMAMQLKYVTEYSSICTQTATYAL